MKTKILLLSIAIATSQMNPLVCMDDTGAQRETFTFQDYSIRKFSLRIDPNCDNDFDKIIEDLLSQEAYISSITSANPVFEEAINLANTQLVTIRDNFFQDLKSINTSKIQSEIDQEDDAVAWIMSKTVNYGNQVKTILNQFKTECPSEQK